MSNAISQFDFPPFHWRQFSVCVTPTCFLSRPTNEITNAFHFVTSFHSSCAWNTFLVFFAFCSVFLSLAVDSLHVDQFNTQATMRKVPQNDRHEIEAYFYFTLLYFVDSLSDFNRLLDRRCGRLDIWLQFFLCFRSSQLCSSSVALTQSYTFSIIVIRFNINLSVFCCLSSFSTFLIVTSFSSPSSGVFVVTTNDSHTSHLIRVASCHGLTSTFCFTATCLTRACTHTHTCIHTFIRFHLWGLLVFYFRKIADYSKETESMTILWYVRDEMAFDNDFVWTNCHNEFIQIVLSISIAQRSWKNEKWKSFDWMGSCVLIAVLANYVLEVFWVVWNECTTWPQLNYWNKCNKPLSKHISVEVVFPKRNKSKCDVHWINRNMFSW